MSSYVNLSRLVSHLMYVGDITSLMSSKKLSVPCISQPSVRPSLNDDITTIRLREIVCDIIPTERVGLISRKVRSDLSHNLRM